MPLQNIALILIENKLEPYRGPEQISERLEQEENLLISHETIYPHAQADKQCGGIPYENLRLMDSPYSKLANGKSTRGYIKSAFTIEQRPPVADDKSRIGDREIDTALGNGHSDAQVTIVELKSKFTLSQQAEHKTAELVTQATT